MTLSIKLSEADNCAAGAHQKRASPFGLTLFIPNEHTGRPLAKRFGGALKGLHSVRYKTVPSGLK